MGHMWEGYKISLTNAGGAIVAAPIGLACTFITILSCGGYRELIENFIVEFEKAFKKADEDGLKHT